MGLFHSIGRLGLRSILSSALTLEREIFDLYTELTQELTETEIPLSLAHILDEELGHQSLLRDMIDGRIGERQMEQIIRGKDLHIHDPGSIEALPVDRHRMLRDRLEAILAKEREIHALFADLKRKSRLPFARRAFGFLEQQERIHVQVLERLLGKSEGGSP